VTNDLQGSASSQTAQLAPNVVLAAATRALLASDIDTGRIAKGFREDSALTRDAIAVELIEGKTMP
jgi:hypothetical protein